MPAGGAEIAAQVLADAYRRPGAGIRRDVADDCSHSRYDVVFKPGIPEHFTPAGAPTPLEGEPQCRFVVKLVGPTEGVWIADESVEIILHELAARGRTRQADVNLQG